MITNIKDDTDKKGQYKRTSKFKLLVLVGVWKSLSYVSSFYSCLGFNVIIIIIITQFIRTILYFFGYRGEEEGVGE